MPLRYEIDPGRRLVYVIGGEVPSPATGILERIRQDPQFERGFNFVRIVKPALEPPSTADMQALVAYLKASADHIAPCRWAVVVPAEGLVFYGMGRMASMLIEGAGIDFQVFVDLDRAVGWATGAAD